MGRKPKSGYEDDGTYVSRSSIDSPPKETDADPRQVEIPGIEESIEKLSSEPHERKFKAELVLKLTPHGERAITIPVLSGEYPSSRVEEILALALSCRRVRNVIAAVLDQPKPETDKATDGELEALNGASEKGCPAEVLGAEVF